MAMMYDMETVNKAMTEAAKLYDQKHPSIRVKRVLDIFAGMKPAEVDVVVHAKWIFSPYEGEPWCECSNCYHVPSRKAYKEAHRCCPCCGAIMDGREVPEDGKA